MTALLHCRVLRSAAAAGVTAVLLCGCAEPSQLSEERRSRGADAAADGSAVSPEEAGAAASPRGLPPAADGTDLDACADAECEVEVAEGDEFSVDGPHGLDRLVVRTVTPSTVTVTGYGDHNSSTVSGTTGAPFGGRPSIVLNGIAVTVLAVEGDRAVIRLVYGDVDLPDLPDLPDLEDLGRWG